LLTPLFPLPGNVSPNAVAGSCIPSIIICIGTPTGYISLGFPKGITGSWTVLNYTGGANSVLHCYCYDPVGGAQIGGGIDMTSGETLQIVSNGGGLFAVGATPPSGAIAMVSEVKIWAAQSDYVPPLWFLCNGQALDSVTYNLLFARIGGAYGYNSSASPHPTFNVPDLRGRVVAGVDHGIGRLPGWALNSGTDANHVNLNYNQMPRHQHTDYGHNHPDPGHVHVMGGYRLEQAYPQGIAFGNGWQIGNKNTEASGANLQAAAANISWEGWGTDVSVIQPTLALNYIIYAGQ
jgi:microcystin-dependent protein